MATTDYCLSRMQIEFVVKDRETQELFNLKSTFDVFKNGFRKAMQNSKDKIALSKSILKKKIEVQYIESDMRILEVLQLKIKITKFSMFTPAGKYLLARSS